MNRAYFDAAYVAKCYLHEPDAAKVRKLASDCDALHTSAFSLAEVACVFHRQLREGTLNSKLALRVREQFQQDVAAGVWVLEPVTERILTRVELLTARLSSDVFLRAGDAIHLVTAADAGFDTIWTNDRHLLTAAPHGGLKGMTVGSH